MYKFEVVLCYYNSILRSYKSCKSAYNFASKYKCPCYVRRFDYETGYYHVLREFNNCLNK